MTTAMKSVLRVVLAFLLTNVVCRFGLWVLKINLTSDQSIGRFVIEIAIWTLVFIVINQILSKFIKNPLAAP